VIVHKLDLNSFKSIREFAAKINETEARLDVLVHNAGYANYLKSETSVDGVEMTMATNHYGPFLLTHLMIDLMKKTAKESPCRIVVVSSITHLISLFNPTKKYHLNPLKHFLPILLYNNTKFANVLFTIELARRLQGTNITANCLHPGMRKNFWGVLVSFIE
jgi:NAD(P)-dependent dehydrogenase (short-subunit alcohol dehydrogenase family)